MRWRNTRRETGLIEHICSHGVGHPNFYSAFRVGELAKKGDGGRSFSAHGCDGCCRRDDFPGYELADYGIAERMLNVIADTFGEKALDDLDDEVRKDLWSWICFTMHDASVNAVLKDRLERHYWNE